VQPSRCAQALQRRQDSTTENTEDTEGARLAERRGVSSFQCFQCFQWFPSTAPAARSEPAVKKRPIMQVCYSPDEEKRLPSAI
jgi:hypothetical protein